MRISTPFIPALCALALGASAGTAQMPGVSLDILPQVGGHLPLADLPQAPSATGVAELEATLAFGGAVELGLPMLPVNLRAAAFTTTSSSVSATGLGETVDQKLIVAVGDLVLRPFPKIIFFEPYLMGGAGVKRYDYDLADVTVGDFQDGNDLTYHVGLGLDIGLGPLAAVIEVNDYISQYQFEDPATGAEVGESELQQDLFASVGIRIGIF